MQIATADAELLPDGLPAQHRTVQLPFYWDQEFPGRAGHATFTMALPALPGEQAQGLFFRRIGNQARLQLGGKALGELGVFVQADLDTTKLSQMVPVPAALLSRPGTETLTIEISAQALRGAALGTVTFGPLADIERVSAVHRTLDRSASAAYAAILVLMGGLAAGLWWRQRDPLYGCFALAAAFGIVRHLNHISDWSPLPWPLWGGVLAVCWAWHLGLIARFITLLLDRDRIWLARLIHAALATTTSLAILSFVLGNLSLWTSGLILLEAVGLVCFWFVLRDALRGRAIAWVILGAGTILLAAGLHDIAQVRIGLAGGSSLPLTPHAMFLLVVVLAGIVVARYNRTLEEFRALNANLGERIAERETQLRGAFETLRVRQEEAAIAEERQRIMREIHDGVGSQLVGLLNMVAEPATGREALEEQTRLALDEMRMAVDALQPAHDNLATVLATLRFRLQPRLKAARIDLVWNVPELAGSPHLAPQAVLHLQRIVSEAFANVLKHARATRIIVAARIAAGPVPTLVFSLSDDGVGFDPFEAASRTGHFGVTNMRARAEGIGARLAIVSAAGAGTTVTLEWPMPRGDGPS